jgi:hypothetical protein
MTTREVRKAVACIKINRAFWADLRKHFSCQRGLSENAKRYASVCDFVAPATDRNFQMDHGEIATGHGANDEYPSNADGPNGNDEAKVATESKLTHLDNRSEKSRSLLNAKGQE